MQHRNTTLTIALAAAFAVAFSVGVTSRPAQASAGDCIHATCSGAKSCKKLQRGCGFVNGTFKATSRDDDGNITGGTCNACF